MNRKKEARRQKEESAKRIMAYQNAYKKALCAKKQRNTHTRG